MSATEYAAWHGGTIWAIDIGRIRIQLLETSLRIQVGFADMTPDEKTFRDIVVFQEIFNELDYKFGHSSKEGWQIACAILERRRQGKFSNSKLKMSTTVAREALIMMQSWSEDQKKQLYDAVIEKIGYSPDVFGEKKEASLLILINSPNDSLDENDLRDLLDYASDFPDGKLAAQVDGKLADLARDGRL